MSPNLARVAQTPQAGWETLLLIPTPFDFPLSALATQRLRVIAPKYFPVELPNCAWLIRIPRALAVPF